LTVAAGAVVHKAVGTALTKIEEESKKDAK